ncbi:MAG: peptidase M48 [Flavobacteriaceae bacterium CG2_30_34_30]|nr:M48 family metallopeptidase [Flavobacteriia bacterium]OIP50451.1 MAG: peptidase M48 [Flavobacteriaceae bacterium CG2_30_34_30]PIQ18238.1 MAG: peptidase M48 [Flavobacteriaceae bacterium CG18_big_fil_WC_8_21_14_2_50_34_36]PIV49679.1 MAG: peptidase M48 [Flavobacteriaceae bacterium CG02_land_8_20_14_3_00_34_13]PIZ09052.1 MAG: peptidase M48 [Flavobacteriaceae bacterium CG_4_10_14_0_8_um_filter_34_31]PJC08290.1 MAG: peptidase M48 [Flavobacteriaceae bacterium CG_4_9_14_0_8_um_filter_34_30]
MTATTVFTIIISILILSFMLDKILEYLNFKKFDDPVPLELADVYDAAEYHKSQAYNKENTRFSMWSSTFSLLLTLSFFFFGGFAFVDALARSISENSIAITLLFFGIILLASDLLSTPFSYYHTFVIEEKYGFNKSSVKLFFLDKLKSWLMGILLGGGILALITWFYESFPNNFWWYTWIAIAIFSVFMNMFYAKLIVPIFNKQKPLEEGSLRDKIEKYATKVGFQLNHIYVIDGSKRSTKANAYFSGFGKEKRITLFDTLIDDLEEEEIVAVLAHEVGHYKKKHILVNLFFSMLLTGLTLWIFSLFISNPLLSQALGVQKPSFHIGLVAFMVLYSPLSAITGLVMNCISRKFEYQADNFAKETLDSEPLISSLKKLSKNSLSNLTPHPAYIFAHYSHPTLLERFKNLKK